MAKFGDIILKGEKAKRGTTIDVEARIITSTLTVKQREADPGGMYCNWIFDLSEAPDELIWLTAARGFVIDKQRDARESDDFKSFGEAIFAYPDDFVRSRKAAKPSEKLAKSYMATLSPEERLALVEAMNQEQINGNGDE